MMEEILAHEAKRFFGRVWEDALGYLRLYDFLKLHTGEILSQTPRRLSSVAEFWYGILGDRFSQSNTKYQPLRDGDVVRLRGGFLTEWAPKLPGQIWTSIGVADLAEGLRSIEGRRRYGDEMYTILDPWGKRQVLNAGHGSVRIATARKDTNHFAYMALVDEEHWHCDYGVPVVVSRPVFREYQRYSENSSPAVKWLEGIVRIGAELPLSQLIPRAIGGKLSKASEDSLRSRPNLPRCYVHVVSPLSTKLLYNRSHPEITAWTMYATSGAKTHGNIDPYGYSYVILNPRISGAYEEAGAFLQHYAKGHGGVRLITDYDGVVPRLEAEIPLSRNAIAGHRPAVRKLMKGIDKWAARTLDRSNR